MVLNRWPVLLAALLFACSSAPTDEVDYGVHCELEAPTTCPTPAVTYADVEPIFKQRCIVCHSGDVGAQWPLNTRAHIADWEDTVRAGVLECWMPPVDSGITMKDDERLAILTWIRCGLPE